MSYHTLRVKGSTLYHTTNKQTMPSPEDIKGEDQDVEDGKKVKGGSKKMEKKAGYRRKNMRRMTKVQWISVGCGTMKMK